GRARPQHVVDLPEVPLLVAAVPAVLEVGTGTQTGIVKRSDGATEVAAVAVAAGEHPRVLWRLAGQAVDAGVVGLRAGMTSLGAVVRRARDVGQRPEVIVEGVVLLHHHDDVIHLVEVAIGPRRRST